MLKKDNDVSIRIPEEKQDKHLSRISAGLKNMEFYFDLFLEKHGRCLHRCFYAFVNSSGEKTA
jgi:hypothetical protein